MEKIAAILESEGVSYEIETDEAIVNFNARSMKNDLRHLIPPNISTHMLSITIQDEDFVRISSHSKNLLLEFGITDQVPDSEDFIPHTGHVIQEELNRNQNRMLAMNLKHQILIGIVIIGIILIIKYID